MRRAGWLLADRINISSFVRFEKSAILKEDYPTAPMTPSFGIPKLTILALKSRLMPKTRANGITRDFGELNLKRSKETAYMPEQPVSILE